MILGQGQPTDGPRMGCEPEASSTWTPGKPVSSETNCVGQHAPQHAVPRATQVQAKRTVLDYEQYYTEVAWS